MSNLFDTRKLPPSRLPIGRPGPRNGSRSPNYVGSGGLGKLTKAQPNAQQMIQPRQRQQQPQQGSPLSQEMMDSLQQWIAGQKPRDIDPGFGRSGPPGDWDRDPGFSKPGPQNWDRDPGQDQWAGINPYQLNFGQQNQNMPLSQNSGYQLPGTTGGVTPAPASLPNHGQDSQLRQDADLRKIQEDPAAWVNSQIDGAEQRGIAESERRKRAGQIGQFQDEYGLSDEEAGRMAEDPKLFDQFIKIAIEQRQREMVHDFRKDVEGKMRGRNAQAHKNWDGPKVKQHEPGSDEHRRLNPGNYTKDGQLITPDDTMGTRGKFYKEQERRKNMTGEEAAAEMKEHRQKHAREHGKRTDEYVKKNRDEFATMEDGTMVRDLGGSRVEFDPVSGKAKVVGWKKPSAEKQAEWNQQNHNQRDRAREKFQARQQNRYKSGTGAILNPVDILRSQGELSQDDYKNILMPPPEEQAAPEEVKTSEVSTEEQQAILGMLMGQLEDGTLTKEEIMPRLKKMKPWLSADVYEQFLRALTAQGIYVNGGGGGGEDEDEVEYAPEPKPKSKLPPGAKPL